MGLQTSGQISLDDMHVEAGGTSGTQVSLNDTDIRGLIDKADGAQMSFSEWYGASAETLVSSNAQQVLASDYVSSGGTIRVSSGSYLYSDSTSTAAITIDVSCTLINEGYILGKGGTGGNRNGNSSGGGPAIKINSGVSGVVIQNQSGAFIAGGGGGGNGGYGGGGGGGAGGGRGGNAYDGNGNSTGGYGGAPGSAGNNSTGNSWRQNSRYGAGGGAGGGGGGRSSDYGGSYYAGGGGGGRIVPGTGGAGAGYGSSGIVSFGPKAAGGSANNNGGYGNDSSGGGGGGWSASGGGSGRGGGSGGGVAINDSGVTYTLTNNGTIYGST